MCRVRVVRAVPGEEVLPPPVLSVRLDPRGAAVRGQPVIPHHTEHVPGDTGAGQDFKRSRNISMTPLTIVLPCLDYS